MRPVYGRSPWVDRVPASRVPAYPAHRGDLSVEVAIIGGGLTGCATAYAFAAAGIRVALFEAARIGRGNSGAAQGWVADEPGVSYATVEAVAGKRAARQAWQAWRRAALDFAALIRKLGITCQAAARPTVRVARTPAEAALLARDAKLRREAGLEGTALSPRALAAAVGFDGIAALRTRDSASLDPYRATLGLAAAAKKRGAFIFERSAVTRTAFTRESASITVGGSGIQARRIIVATGMPGALFASLERHVSTRTTALVLTDVIPAKLRQTLGPRDLLVRDWSDPPHRLSWVDNERLLVGGADSDVVPVRTRDRVQVQRTGQLMYELSLLHPDLSGLPPAYGWLADYGVTARGLPLIGPHRNYPHHLFAFGDSSHGMTGAYLASRILLRHHTGQTQAADGAFAFTR